MNNLYFDLILSEKAYCIFDNEDVKFINIELLLTNRKKKFILYMSSDCIRIAAASFN